jgi:hypothetical protein
MAGTTIRLDTTKLNQLISSMPKRKDQTVRDAAFLVEQQAKMNIQAWPLIDTGALLNSIAVEKISLGHYEVGDFGGYTKKRKRSRFRWRSINVGMEYGVYWELGHHNLFTRHYMRMPFLGPALVTATNKIIKMISEGLFNERL